MMILKKLKMFSDGINHFGRVVQFQQMGDRDRYQMLARDLGGL